MKILIDIFRGSSSRRLRGGMPFKIVDIGLGFGFIIAWE